MGKQPPPDGTHHAVIVNTARTPEESITNGHWIALLRHKDSEIIYDSYGRDTEDFAPALAHLEPTRQDAEQPLDPNVQWCGHLSSCARETMRRTTAVHAGSRRAAGRHRDAPPATSTIDL
jgi:hypothetical protein